ncbi:MAG: MFS transporter [Candidatus Thorarchaeota archaeon]
MTEQNHQNGSFKEVIKSMNYNVKLTFAFYTSSSIGRGIWMGNVLSLFIILLMGDDLFLGFGGNEILGLTSAASGITMTLFVFPAGYLADKFRRDIILKSATSLGLAALVFVSLVGSNFLTFELNIIFIFISMLLWGFFNALVRPSLEAIFADSVESGYRSKIYSWGHMIQQFSMALGPFLNIALFYIFGNEWTVKIMRSVMFVGLVISLASIIILFFFRDEKSLGEVSEAIRDEVTEVVVEASAKSRVLNLTSEKAAKMIPFLLVASNVIIGIGAGMTIKFFPVFFKEIYVLNPVAIQVIMGFTSLLTGILGIIAQKFSLKQGRVQMIYWVQFIATACLVVLAIYPPLWVLVPIFIARGSFMNAAQPLSRSILMDIIPKKNRGRWNSVEAIAWGLFWNMSAVIGGFLVGDNNNFNLCFTITAFVYILGMIPIIIMMPMVGKEREALEKDNLLEEAVILNEDKDEPLEEVFSLSTLNPEKDSLESLE